MPLKFSVINGDIRSFEPSHVHCSSGICKGNTRNFFIKGHLIRDSTENLEEFKGQHHGSSSEFW